MSVARSWEAQLVSWWLNPLLEGGVIGTGAYYLVWITPEQQIAFHVTAECSAVVLIAPLLVVSALFMSSQRVKWSRGISGIISMLVIIVTANQLRLAVIAWATQVWGMSPGYEVSHRLVGSLIGIGGFIVGLIALILISGLRQKNRPFRKAAH